MKSIRNRTLLLAILVGGATSARAELWQSGATLRAGQASVGAFGQYYFYDPGEFMMIAQGAYGVTDRFQAEVRLGAGTLDGDVGIFGKYELMPDRTFRQPVAMSLWGGFEHLKDLSYLKVGWVVSYHVFGEHPFQLYGAPIVALGLGEAHTGLALVPGVDFAVTPRAKFYAEFVVDISNYYNAGSLGLRYFF